MTNIAIAGLRFLKQAEVMKLTGYSRSSLYRLMHAGEFPAALRFGGKVGGSLRWRADDIEAWIASRERVATNGDRATA